MTFTAQNQIYRLSSCKHGVFLINHSDTYVCKSLELYGEWSEHEVSLFTQILKPGHHAVEAGSNVGSHTVFISKAVGDAGQVFSFEPMRFTHQLLNANLALNECFNVQTFKAAVGNENGEIQFPVINPQWGKSNFGGVSAHNLVNAPTDAVPVIAMDSMSFERLDFMKADIEGAEYVFLQGAQATIGKHRPVIYLEFGSDKDDLIAFLEQMDYSCFYYVSPMFNVDNFKQHAVDIFDASSTDFICVPNEKASVSGLTRATPNDGLVTWGNGVAHFKVEHYGNAVFSWLNG